MAWKGFKPYSTTIEIKNLFLFMTKRLVHDCSLMKSYQLWIILILLFVGPQKEDPGLGRGQWCQPQVQGQGQSQEGQEDQGHDLRGLERPGRALGAPHWQGCQEEASKEKVYYFT